MVNRIAQSNASVPPFFIVGCGRSGTTLLRRMIHAHPLLAVPPESLFMIDYLRVRDHVDVDMVRQLMVKEYEFSEWDLDVRSEDLSGLDSVETILDHLHEAYAARLGKQHWGQKTPRFIRYGALLKDVYPDARFIHIIRDPRAVAVSLSKSNVHRSNIYYGAKRWLTDVSAGVQLKQQYPDDVLEIYYEDLAGDPEAVLNQVVAFIGVPDDAAMLNYHQQQTSDYGTYHDSIHRNLTKPVSTDRVEAWRNDLTTTDIAMVEQLCSPLMEQVGYLPEAVGVTVPGAHIRRFKIDRVLRGIPQQVWQYFNGRTYHLFFSIWRKLRLGLLWGDAVSINT